MNNADPADSNSPWYEAFTPSQNLAQAGWSAPVFERDSQLTGEPIQVEDAWATEAIFDYYNS